MKSGVTHQDIWSIAKIRMKRSGPKTSTPIYGPTTRGYYAISNCLENQFIRQDMCDENHERRVEARVWVLLETVDDNSLERVRLHDVETLINLFQLGNCKRIPQAPSQATGVYDTFFFFYFCSRLSHFPLPCKEAKMMTLPKLGKDPSSKLRPISLLITAGTLFKKAVLKNSKGT
jgi:hypothetical protein